MRGVALAASAAVLGCGGPPDGRMDARPDGATAADEGPPDAAVDEGGVPDAPPPDLGPDIGLFDAALCPSDLGPVVDATTSLPLDGATPGALRWGYVPPGFGWSGGSDAPVVAPDGTITVVYLAYWPTVLALSPDGEVLWEAEIESDGFWFNWCHSVDSAGRIYVTFDLGHLVPVSADGEVLDKAGFESGGVFGKDIYPFVSCPSIGPADRVYVSTIEGSDLAGETSWGRLYAYEFGDEDFAWTMTLGDEVTGPPAIGEDGTVYLGVRHEEPEWPDEIIAVRDGEYIWRLPVDGVGTAVQFAHDELLFAATPVSGGWGILEVDPTGCMVRVLPLPDEITSFNAMLALHDGYLGFNAPAYATTAPAVFFVDRNGELVWTIVREESGFDYVSWDPLVGADGTIYFGVSGDGTGTLRAVGLDGVERWRVDPDVDGNGGAPIEGTMALMSDGTLYTVGGGIFAFETASPGLLDAPWPHPRHDNRGSSWAGAEP